MKLIVATIFLLGLVFLSTPSVVASVCVVPEVSEALHRAKAVFVGKVVNVTASENSKSPNDYLVRFEVRNRWKGTVSRETSFLWRSEIPGCSFFPVGQIGEYYLVYADSSRSDFAGKDKFEITILNRTSIVPRPVQTVRPSNSAGERKSASFVIQPELNRRNATKDIQALQRIQDCGCLEPYTVSTCMGSLSAIEPSNPNLVDRPANASACCTCLRRSLLPVTSGFLIKPLDSSP
jgi:hypothetical protein